MTPDNRLFVIQSIEGWRKNTLLNAQILGVDKVPGTIFVGVTEIQIPYKNKIVKITYKELMDLVTR
jgi:hypothetical protein